MRRLGVLLLMIFLLRGAEPTRKHRVLFNRFLIPDLGLFIADADGKNERPLVPHGEIEYSPNVSLDGKWVVFTSEHQGLAVFTACIRTGPASNSSRAIPPSTIRALFCPMTRDWRSSRRARAARPTSGCSTSPGASTAI